jgi:Heparinase II/III-like protein/Heparinase II/III N-terminus
VQARLERLHRLVGGAPSPAASDVTFAYGSGFASFDLAGRGPAAIARAAADHDPEWGASCRAQYLQLERGMVSLLGFSALPVGHPPGWHREALSRLDAPRLHWSRIDHLDSSIVGDHKILWEPNRHQYLLAPAVCWLLDRDERAFNLIRLHLESWLTENPPGIGVNWVSSLEVAYRAIAWCWLLWLLGDAPWADLRARLAASLEAHGRHIERYLSTYCSPNTHLTGEALGLFYLGTVLEDSRIAARWRHKGAGILEEWLDRQVLPDGVYFEQASQYHRYTTEIYLHYALLGESTGWKVSASVRAALGRLLDVLRSVASADGRIPLLGDDDGGLLLPLDHRPPDDVRALLLAGAVLLQRPELTHPGAAPGLAYWLCGIEPTERLIRAGETSPAWRDIQFETGGLAAMRDGWTREDAVAVIDAGPHGALSCGHSHADAMAMTLALGESPLFVDRGTLTYVGPRRDEYRSTQSHNTLEFDRESSVTPAQAFRWVNVPERAWGAVYSSGEMSGFAGLGLGHSGSVAPSTHERWILHQRAGAWVILDRGHRRGTRVATVRWQLAPGLRAERLDDRTALIRSQEGAVLATVFAPISTAMRITTRGVSPRLGQEVAAEVLEIRADESLAAMTVIVPGEVPARVDDSSSGLAGPGVSFQWQDQAARHRVSTDWLEGGRDGPGISADLCWRLHRSGSVTAASQELVAAFRTRSLEVKASEGFVTTPKSKVGKMVVFEKVNGEWLDRGVSEPRPSRPVSS